VSAILTPKDGVFDYQTGDDVGVADVTSATVEKPRGAGTQAKKIRFFAEFHSKSFFSGFPTAFSLKQY